MLDPDAVQGASARHRKGLPLSRTVVGHIGCAVISARKGLAGTIDVLVIRRTGKTITLRIALLL